MEACKKCGGELPPRANFCPVCGRRVNAPRAAKKRGNGQGTVIQTKSGKYLALVTLGYYTDESGKRHRRTRSKVYERKKDAIAAIPSLLADPRRTGPGKTRSTVTKPP